MSLLEKRPSLLITALFMLAFAGCSENGFFGNTGLGFQGSSSGGNRSGSNALATPSTNPGADGTGDGTTAGNVDPTETVSEGTIDYGPITLLGMLLSDSTEADPAGSRIRISKPDGTWAEQAWPDKGKSKTIESICPRSKKAMIKVEIVDPDGVKFVPTKSGPPFFVIGYKTEGDSKSVAVGYESEGGSAWHEIDAAVIYLECPDSTSLKVENLCIDMNLRNPDRDHASSYYNWYTHGGGGHPDGNPQVSCE